jgi:hypothetical protein
MGEGNAHHAHDARHGILKGKRDGLFDCSGEGLLGHLTSLVSLLGMVLRWTVTLSAVQ